MDKLWGGAEEAWRSLVLALVNVAEGGERGLAAAAAEARERLDWDVIGL